MKEIIDSFPIKHKMLLSVAICLTLVFLLIPTDDAIASKHIHTVLTDYQDVELGKVYSLPLDIKPSQNSLKNLDQPIEKKVKIKSGDSLASTFKKVNVPQKTMLALSRSGGKAKSFTRLMPGKTLIFNFSKDNKFTSVSYQIDRLTTLVATELNSGKFEFSELKKEVTKTTKYFYGEIKSNFWKAAEKAGFDDSLIMNFANVFAWDVDFGLDLRGGDSFYGLVEQVYVDGEFIGYGDIIAAEFVNRGEIFEAVRYTDGRYYTPNGDSMRKAFLRAPVNFKYISSNFNPYRYHPILKRIKPHRGIDYAAKTGTPVVAAGDGKVTASTYNKYNGHYVFIEHGGGITTKYLHFSKRRVKKGQRVKQGQLIGHVGSTGMSAGPHLHYEFLVNGVHRNPRTVALPKAEPINKNQKEAFLAFSQVRMQQLAHNKQLLLAML